MPDLHGNAPLHSPAERAARLGQTGCVCWFTGLSGSGKSTVARALEARLVEAGRCAYVLDGDNVRGGLNADLDFSPAARQENIRRIGEVAALFAEAGVITAVAFISPYRADRELARSKVPAGRFLEIHLATDLATCETRDPKGLYVKARSGAIADFTGIDAPYEPPPDPELRLDTATTPIDQAVDRIHNLLRAESILPANSASKTCGRRPPG